MRSDRFVGLALLAMLLAAPWPVSAIADAPLPPGILRRYDFSPELDGWSAISGTPTLREAGGQHVVELEGARIRSPDMPPGEGLRFLVAFRLEDAIGRADLLDLRDADGDRIARLYAHVGKVWIEGAGPRQGFALSPGTSWHRGEIWFDGTTATGFYDTQGLSVATASLGPVASIEIGASSGGLLVDIVRVDRMPRVDDGLVARATYDALEHFDPAQGSAARYEADQEFQDPGHIVFASQATLGTLAPGTVDFVAAPLPGGEFLVETSFAIRNEYFRPDGTAVAAALPGTSGAAAPLWWVSLDVPLGAAKGISALTFNGPDGSRRHLADVDGEEWRVLVAHGDPATETLRLHFDDALVLETEVPGLAQAGRMALGDVTPGLVPIVERTGMPIDVFFDGGIPMALLEPASAP